MRMRFKVVLGALLAAVLLVGLVAGAAFADDQHMHWGEPSDNGASYGLPSDSHGIGGLQNGWGKNAE